MRYEIYSGGRSEILNISCIGCSADPTVTRFGPATRDLYILHYVTAGTGYFNKTPVRAGQGFLITPGTWEEYYPDEDDPWEFLWVICDDPNIEALLREHLQTDENHVFYYDFVSSVRELCRELKHRHNTICGSCRMLEYFLRLFKHHEKATDRENRSNAEIYIDAAENYIRNKLFLPITVRDLTVFLGVSQPYLYKLFQSRFAMSPKQYISNCKLSHARQLLRQSQMSVTQVAASVGFADVLSFSKFFTLHEGCSPLAYRGKSE